MHPLKKYKRSIHTCLSCQAKFLHKSEFVHHLLTNDQCKKSSIYYVYRGCKQYVGTSLQYLKVHFRSSLAKKHNCEQIFHQFREPEVIFPPVPPDLQSKKFVVDENVHICIAKKKELRPPLTYVFGRSLHNPNDVQFVQFNSNHSGDKCSRYDDFLFG